MKEKTMVAMSGGVDSAVAALLVRDAGYPSAGITMRLWSEQERVTDDLHSPCEDENIRDARAIADRLGIKHFAVSLGESFYRSVISPFIQSYVAGQTPNPCVICNREIKFGKLFEVCRTLGYPRLATGHYARIERDANGRYLLCRARDDGKDQSYFLWSLSQEVLSSVLFPLGSYTKPQIRQIAAEHGFVNAHRSDSQDICFIPDGDYVSFIEAQTQRDFPKGNFVDVDGGVLGQHEGLIRYTVGQRKGLGIALGEPMFVKEKNALLNTVTLARNDALFSDTLTASQVNWIACDPPTAALRVQAKIRYRHTPAKATVEPIESGCVQLRFDQPQRAIAPGQSVVFYDGDTVIGGGIID